MDKDDQERYNRLCRRSKYNFLCDYLDMKTLKEVQDEARLDYYFIDKLFQKNYNEYFSIHNLLKAFVNYICYSTDKDVEPLGLYEDDFNGFNYFELMQKIYNKFHKEE